MPLRVVRATLLIAAAALLPALAGRAARASADSGAPRLYRNDAIEIRLAPSASRRVAALRRATRASGALRNLGVESVDRALGGARFEALFPADDPPPAGSPATDLAAFYRASLPPGESVEDALSRLAAMPDVASAERIALLPASFVPDDSLWSIATWFYQSSRRDIHAPEAWDVTAGDSSVVIAVLDTGVLPWHPDLGGALPGERGNLWRNAAETNGVAGVDDDGNGYVDDVAGWDFVNLASSSQVIAGEDWRDADPDPSDFSGHGTLVASLAAGLTDNGIGGAGTAWRSRILPLRVGFSAPANPAGLMDMSYAASAIRYATLAGASVINCSFETTNSGGLLAAAAAATRAGVVIVNSAGNGTTDIALSLREDVISVAASDANDAIANFSNTGAYVDLAAPGVGIAGAFVSHVAGDSVSERTPAYAVSSGTSFSAPLVSGAAALVQARRKLLGAPPLRAMDVLFRLRETADDVSALNPGASGYGTGRLNLARALAETHTSHVAPMGARTVGPPVVVRTKSGSARIALVTFNNRLLVLTPGGDTLVNVALPGRPARQLAAADLGGGRGIGLFVGCVNGKLAGYDLAGNPLPGWPASAADAFVSLAAGPALGDLDGDGVLEVVCGGGDGLLYAWDADGNALANFPVATGAAALSFPVALSDLDGLAGAEIVVTAADGWVTAYRHDGSEAAGWPRPFASPAPSSPPVVGPLGAGNAAAVIFGRGASLEARNSDGTPRFATSLAVTIAQEPVLADVDGDGLTELVAAGTLSAAHQLVVVDSAGAVRAGAGWPRALDAAVNGAPLAGPLRPGARRGVLASTAAGLAAFTDSAQAIPSFPRPGLAGATSTLADLDGSGHTTVAAGTGPDSLFYFYDAGVGTWADLAGTWPTARGNFARTGSTLYAPALPVLDDVPPAAIADLAPDSIGPTSFALRWTAPGDDGASGRASAYELEVSTLKGTAGTFTGPGVRRDLAPPDTSGTPERAVIAGLVPGVTYFCAARARDAAGNWGPSSAALSVTTPLGAARRDTSAAWLRPLASPTPAPLAFRWRAAGEERGAAHAIELFDVAGRLVRRLALGTAAGGVASWDGRNEEGRPVGAGLYFARLAGGSFRADARVIVLR